MKFGAYLTGAFGQSRSLYEARNEFKRGRGTQEKIDSQVLNDTFEIIQKQKKAGLTFIIDPMFSFNLLQPFAESVQNVSVGPQENWFNNNLFYFRPQILAALKTRYGFTSRYLSLTMLPKDGRAMAVIPSPYTLLEMSDLINGYKNKKSVIKDLAQMIKADAESLTANGINRIQYDEPVIAQKQTLGELEKEDLELLRISIEECGKIPGATTSLHTYFGNVAPILPNIIDLPVDCIGIDMSETRLDEILEYKFNNKQIALGLIHTETTEREELGQLVDTLKRVAQICNPRAIYLTPNTGTELIGWTKGIEIIELLGKTVGALNAKKTI